MRLAELLDPGRRFGSQESKFARGLPDRGSALAGQSMVADNIAEHAMCIKTPPDHQAATGRGAQ